MRRLGRNNQRERLTGWRDGVEDPDRGAPWSHD